MASGTGWQTVAACAIAVAQVACARAAAGAAAGVDAAVDVAQLAEDATQVDVFAADATADTALIPPPVARAPSALALQDIVGLSSHPALGAEPAAVKERAFEWNAMKQLGIHRLRTDFRFSAIEPQPAVWDFSAYDPLVSEAAAHGVNLLALLDATAPWATPVVNAGDGYPPKDPQDFATFAAKVADRYKATVSEYEVWNEPNNGVTFWKADQFAGEPDKYAALFLLANQDIHAAQPTAQVAFGAILYHFIVSSGPEFLANALQATPALAAAIGVFSLHPYPLYPPVSSPESAVGDEVPLPTQIATMNGLLAAAGASTATVPFWLTELGWSTTSQLTPAQQARYTVRAVVLSALAGADRLYLYTLLDDANAFGAEGDFGLMTPGDVTGTGSGIPPQPKPAFVALQTLLQTVGGFHVAAQVPQPGAPGAWLVRLEQAGQVACVAWRTEDATTPTTVQLPFGGKVRVTQLDGTFHDDAAAAGNYVVAVGADPVIVTQRQ